MNHWKHRIDVSHVFHDDDLSLPEKGQQISAIVKAAPFWPGVDGDDLEQIIEELEDAAADDDVNWFDLVWSAFYDWADANRVWVETRP